MDNTLWEIAFRDPHKLALFVALIIGAVGSYLVYRSTIPDSPRSARIIMGVLRFIAVATIIFALLDPVLRIVTKKEIIPKLVFLVDNSQSMSISDPSGDRKKIVREILTSKILAKLKERFPCEFFLFSDSLKPFSEPDFSGNGTAIGNALQKILDTAQTMDIGAVVLISDGQNNIGIDPISVSPAYPFPVFTIGVGDPTPMRDVMVANVISSPVAYVDESLKVVADIRAWRAGEEKVMVNLYEGRKKIASKQVMLPAEGQSVRVEFALKPDKEGIHYYKVSVPTIKGEATKSNNQRVVSVNVLSSRKKVLIACDHLSWEVTFWKRGISQDPHIKVYLYSKKGGGDKNLRLPSPSPEALLAYDAIVLIHCGPLLKREFGNALSQYVKQGGSILILLDESTPLGSSGLRALSNALPVEFVEPIAFRSGELTPKLGGDGYTSPITDIEGIAEELPLMPPLMGFVPVRPKPDASVLISCKLAGGKDTPILVVGRCGSGKSAIVAGSPLWRWAMMPMAYGRDSKVFMKLVRNLTQYLLAKEKIERFKIMPSKRVFSSGEPITFSAAVRNELNKPLSAAVVSVRILNPDSEMAEVSSTELTEITSGVYEASIPSLSPGRYIIKGIATLNGDTIGKASTAIMVEPFKIELAKTNQDEALLKLLAEHTGGKYLPASLIEKLDDELKLDKRVKMLSHEKELWNLPILLVIAVCSLAVEWILRKKFNLM